MNLARTHANYAHTWWTPEEWMAWAFATMGSEYLWDPCPMDYEGGGHESGLVRKWAKRTYCNHPGGRGAAQEWWAKYQAEQARHLGTMKFIWCAFNVEQFRHLRQSPFELPGWIVWPRDRIGYVWGGPDMSMVDGKLIETSQAPGHAIHRAHGERQRSPGQWSAFWTNCEPAEPPGDCMITRTGGR
jgi:hypothetical protein